MNEILNRRCLERLALRGGERVTSRPALSTRRMHVAKVHITSGMKEKRSGSCISCFHFRSRDAGAN